MRVEIKDTNVITVLKSLSKAFCATPVQIVEFAVSEYVRRLSEDNQTLEITH